MSSAIEWNPHTLSRAIVVVESILYIPTTVCTRTCTGTCTVPGTLSHSTRTKYRVVCSTGTSTQVQVVVSQSAQARVRSTCNLYLYPKSDFVINYQYRYHVSPVSTSSLINFQPYAKGRDVKYIIKH